MEDLNMERESLKLDAKSFAFRSGSCTDLYDDEKKFNEKDCLFLFIRYNSMIMVNGDF